MHCSEIKQDWHLRTRRECRKYKPRHISRVSGWDNYPFKKHDQHQNFFWSFLPSKGISFESSHYTKSIKEVSVSSSRWRGNHLSQWESSLGVKTYTRRTNLIVIFFQGSSFSFKKTFVIFVTYVQQIRSIRSCGDRGALNSILILILAEKIHSHTVISHPMRSANTCQHIMQSVFFSHSIYQGVKTKCLFNYLIDPMNPPT